MGADLLAVGLAMPKGRSLNFEAAKAAARKVGWDDLDVNYRWQLEAHVEMEGHDDLEEGDVPKVRDLLLESLDAIEAAADGADREGGIYTFDGGGDTRPVEVFFTAGMSSGDDPSELYAALQLVVECAPVREALYIPVEGQVATADDQEGERGALDLIRSLLHGKEWSVETVSEIASIVRGTGREVGDTDGGGAS